MNRFLGFASTTALAACLAAPVADLVQQTPPASPQTAGDTTEVVVTGHAYQLEKAIEAKKAITVISDSVSADEIGAIPEFGFGEALQRLPGVSFIMNNGRGEAQFATLRGLNPDYNSTTIDGIALPSTEETRRQVSLDVLPSVIASRISYFKTYTADLPGDAIGGVVDLKTHSAFEHDGPFVSGRADYAH